jgi:hypothetical protein
LPDLAVEAGVLDLGDDDVVGFPEEGDAFGGDFAEDADGEAGSGEGLALEDLFGHVEVAASITQTGKTASPKPHTDRTLRDRVVLTPSL